MNSNTQSGGLIINQPSPPSQVKQIFTRMDPNGGPATGYYRSRSISSPGSFFMPFIMPQQFDTLVGIFLWIIPTVTEADRSIGIDSFWGPPGGSITANADTSTIVGGLTASQHTIMDFTASYTGILAGDLPSARVQNYDAQLIWCVGIIVRYI